MQNLLTELRCRRGSVAVVIAGIFLALLVAFSAFMKYSTSRQYATKKLNKVLLAREFSAALATLACHQLKQKDIKNLSSKLVQKLSLPISGMDKEASDKIVFQAPAKGIVDKLKAANSELRDLTYEISWELQKADFQPCLEAYPREKTGILRLPILVSYKAPGSNDLVKEDYLYSTRVKVVANLVPVLARFSLYVEDAVAGEGPDRFNKVETNSQGNLLPSCNFKPWVLDNGLGSDKFPERFANVISSGRGLVYLGGGRLNLGIARGWNEPGKYGEGFHLFAEGRGDGLYTTSFLGSMALLNWETGLCNDLSDDANIFWWELIKDGYDAMSKNNSIFRLNGTDQDKSPTLVLGEVMSRTLCARCYRESSENFGPLPYVNSDDKFADYTSGESEVFNISFFMSEHQKAAGALNRGSYNAKYASSLIEEPYNRALAYIITNFKAAHPMDTGAIPSGDPLADFASGKAVTSGLAHKVPAPFDSVYSGVTDLKRMSEFLTQERLMIPGTRTARTIELGKGQKLLTALEQRGLLSKDKLDLNGWVFVKAKDSVAIDSSLRLCSHGGIIVEKGNIEIKNPIRADGGEFLLNLVALNGNITIDSSLGGELDIALTACGNGSDGQVKFPGNSSTNNIKINGNVAMHTIAGGTLSTAAARGVEIVYNRKLSAMPGQTADEGSEKSLLMFDLKDLPQLVD